MRKSKDFGIGQLVKHKFSETDIRIGIIKDITTDNYRNSWGAECDTDEMGGFFFFEEDLENVTILTKEKNPEYYL
ncbi:MAG: hypothetical protein J7L15_03140 [Clostridiales bacterium]|nr:hypothetical protein [Clostridiales bacterium]